MTDGLKERLDAVLKMTWALEDAVAAALAAAKAQKGEGAEEQR